MDSEVGSSDESLDATDKVPSLFIPPDEESAVTQARRPIPSVARREAAPAPPPTAHANKNDYWRSAARAPAPAPTAAKPGALPARPAGTIPPAPKHATSPNLIARVKPAVKSEPAKPAYATRPTVVPVQPIVMPAKSLKPVTPTPAPPLALAPTEKAPVIAPLRAAASGPLAAQPRLVAEPKRVEVDVDLAFDELVAKPAAAPAEQPVAPARPRRSKRTSHARPRPRRAMPRAEAEAAAPLPESTFGSGMLQGKKRRAQFEVAPLLDVAASSPTTFGSGMLQARRGNAKLWAALLLGVVGIAAVLALHYM